MKIGEMNKNTRRQVFDKFGGRCAYCGNQIEYKDMQVDHCIPKMLKEPLYGGISNDIIEHIDNLMPSCRLCNHYKRGATLEGFRELMLTLHERIAQNYIVRVGIKYGLISNTHPFSGKFYFETIKNQNNEKI